MSNNYKFSSNFGNLKYSTRKSNNFGIPSIIPKQAYNRTAKIVLIIRISPIN